MGDPNNRSIQPIYYLLICKISQSSLKWESVQKPTKCGTLNAHIANLREVDVSINTRMLYGKNKREIKNLKANIDS